MLIFTTYVKSMIVNSSAAKEIWLIQEVQYIIMAKKNQCNHP